METERIRSARRSKSRMKTSQELLGPFRTEIAALREELRHETNVHRRVMLRNQICMLMNRCQASVLTVARDLELRRGGVRSDRQW